MTRRVVAFIFLLSLPLFSVGLFGQNISERFKNSTKLNYGVYFNGIYSGKITWEYLGRDKLINTAVDIISLNSDTRALAFLDLTSREKIFLNSQNGLPVKVERDVLFFGKKEIITETYDQANGLVKIVRAAGKNALPSEEILKPGKPVHNILALIYFFPENIGLNIPGTFSYNLPTQKLSIQTRGTQVIKLNNQKVEAYFLTGRGAKKFRVWLDKSRRVPLRLEFILPVGKLAIVSEDSPQK